MNSVEPRGIFVDPLSGCSLKIDAIANSQHLGSATGFIITRRDRHFLVTNWHVVTGRHPDTNQARHQSLAVPDSLNIWFHASTGLGNWVSCNYRLYDDAGRTQWWEHPSGRAVDVVLIPLEKLDSVVYYGMPLELADTDMIPTPAMPVSIIGFPLGLSTGGLWPIWKTGHIASDPDINYDGRPAFLIDATTRGGMSGSPVILRLSGGYRTSSGNFIMSMSRFQDKLLGIYAGRIHEDSEVGRVWRPSLIHDILTHHGA